MIEPSDAEVNAAIRASFEPKIPRDVMPKPGPTARHNFRAGYRAGIVAGIERAAKVCDRYEQHKWHIYKDGDGDLRADPHIQGQADGAADCSAAIRALNAPAAP